jgi:glycosyltransferase involved in cell wall biosynthesis
VLPDAIITTGEEIRQGMINDNGYNAVKIFSIPTGIDIERFNPEKVRPAFLTNGFSIGMVGVLRSWKGHRFFIEAIPEILGSVADAHFFIIGDGPQYENIKKLLSGQPFEDRVLMLGHREDIPEVLASLDVLVHPSYANEGIPQSVLQAMAMEKPVVASDAGAIKEAVIDGSTGFLIPSGNAHEIALKAISLYKTPELGKAFGIEGRRLVEKMYSFDGMLDKIEMLYDSLNN